MGATAAVLQARRAFSSPERRETLDAELQLRTAEEVAAALGNLKGAMMKLGQMASYVDEGVPEPLRYALAQLQQDAPPMSPSLVADVISEELGDSPHRVFREWDVKPIAAASIGQVHRARTHDGRAVAVKVQYPGVEEAIRADLDNLDVATFAVPFVWRNVDAKGLAAELRVRLIEELDYRTEAAAQQQFASWYAGHPFIEIPDIVPEHSTRRVLTMGIAEGARFSEVERWTQDQRDKAGETIFRFAFRSLYRFHAFNADPHPGNYLFQPDGRVAFLDFGVVRRFSSEEMGQLLDLVQTAVLEPDAVRLRRAAERAGFVPHGAPITDERIAEYQRIFWETVLDDEVVAMTNEHASRLIRRLLFAHNEFPDVMEHCNIPPRFLFLQRITVGLVAILGRLGAQANWRRIAEELWPNADAPPSTELGRLEAEWWAGVRGIAPASPLGPPGVEDQEAQP